MNEWDSMFSKEEKQGRLLGAKIAQMLNGLSVEKAIFTLDQAKKLIFTHSNVNVTCNEFKRLINVWKKAKSNN
jgi:hypothetical protein